MSERIQGTLERIAEKPTDYGTMYDLVVNGQSYGMGKFKPKQVSPGDYIEFEAAQKPGSRFWNVKAGSLSKTSKPAGVPDPAPARSYSGSTGGGYEDRQKVISKQAALNSALTYVGLLNAAGALPIPASAKTDKKADLVKAVVMETTAEFYHLATGETYDMPESGSDDLSAAEADENWNEE